MKVITTTHYNRPECTARFFAALLKCEGIHSYKILVFIDKSDTNVSSIIREFGPLLPSMEVIENGCQLGMYGNKLQAVHAGFTYDNFVIHFEDDCIPAVDCLRYFEFVGPQIDRKNIFSISAYNNPKPGTIDVEKNYKATSQRSWYTPWGRALFLPKIRRMLLTWDGDERKMNEERGNREEIFPVVSRVQNYGYILGEERVKLYEGKNKFRETPEWYKRNHWSRCFADDFNFEGF